MRLELQMSNRAVGRDPRRPRIEMQRGHTRLTVEALVVEHDIGGTYELRSADAATRPALAAYLEQIREVVVERQCEIEGGAPVTVILQTDALIGGAAPQENGAHDVQHIFLQQKPALAVDIGIGEIDGERRIVVAEIGAEQQWLHVLEDKL